MPDPPNDALREIGTPMPDTIHTPEAATVTTPLDGDGWRLPSGEDLISFALNVGLAASPLVELNGSAGTRAAAPRGRAKNARRRAVRRSAPVASPSGFQGKEVK